MEIELINKLLTKMQEQGQAKYRFYTFTKLEDKVEVKVKEKEIAQFVITGYEQGYLAVNEARTPYQKRTIGSLVAFLTGKY